MLCAVMLPTRMLRNIRRYVLIGPIPWGHSGPLCHALSLSSSSWTSMRRRRATVPLATFGEWAWGGSWRMGSTFFKCFLFWYCCDVDSDRRTDIVCCCVANKDASVKIEELKKHADSRLAKGLMPEDTDSLLVCILFCYIYYFEYWCRFVVECCFVPHNCVFLC